MNGLALSRAYFEEYGRPMLEAQFPAVLPFLAADFEETDALPQTVRGAGGFGSTGMQ